MLEWMLFIVHHLFVHFWISSSFSFKRKTKRHVFLLLFVLTIVHLNWPSYATGKCYRSPRQLISTMKHWWLYITIHSLTIFKWKICDLRLNLIYLSFFVQFILSVNYTLFAMYTYKKSFITIFEGLSYNMTVLEKWILENSHMILFVQNDFFFFFIQNVSRSLARCTTPLTVTHFTTYTVSECVSESCQVYYTAYSNTFYYILCSRMSFGVLPGVLHRLQ